MAEQGLVITTDNKMWVEDFTNPLYKTAGAVVGGTIEHVCPTGLERPYCMIVDDSGLLKDKPINAYGSYVYGYAWHGQPIVGDIIIMKDGYRNGERDIVGLDDTDLALIAKHALRVGVTWREESTANK